MTILVERNSNILEVALESNGSYPPESVSNTVLSVSNQNCRLEAQIYWRSYDRTFVSVLFKVVLEIFVEHTWTHMIVTAMSYKYKQY